MLAPVTNHKYHVYSLGTKPGVQKVESLPHSEVTLADLELLETLLTQFPKDWEYKYTPLYRARFQVLILPFKVISPKLDLQAKYLAHMEPPIPTITTPTSPEAIVSLVRGCLYRMGIEE